jgi:hypothetical protein
MDAPRTSEQKLLAISTGRRFAGDRDVLGTF